MDAGISRQDTDIAVSRAERRAGELSAENLRLATILLHTKGCVVLRGAIPPPVVADADDAFADVFADCLASRDSETLFMAGITCRVAHRTRAVFWERNHRWRVFPRLRPPFDSAHLLANPLAMPLLGRLLGDGFQCKFVSSDTCVAGAEIQSPHREMDPGLSWEPRGYIVNVPLHRCDLDNGPLEVWPCGSHLWRDDVLRGLGYDDTVQDGRNPDLERLAAMFPSRRVVLDPGDILIRDPALMHRGTVNRTDRPRTMLAICYFRAGLTHNYGRLDLSLDRALFEALPANIQQLYAGFAAPATV